MYYLPKRDIDVDECYKTNPFQQPEKVHDHICLALTVANQELWNSILDQISYKGML